MHESIKLQNDAIFQVPFGVYENNFTFVINNVKFGTNKIVADLLSPRISKLHQADPTLDEFIITTKHQGNFEHILNLINFEEEEINKQEIQFFIEIFEELGSNHFKVNSKEEEITLDNIIPLIQQHEQCQDFYSVIFQKEINFLSSHFHDILSSQKEEIKKFSYDTLEQIINNENLELDTEDELLAFINELYNENENFSSLYEYVYFNNVSVNSITNFLKIFDIEYLTTGIWESISTRLIEEIKENSPLKKTRNCYQKKINEKLSKVFKEIKYSNDQLDGIFSYLNDYSEIKDEVSVTYSSYEGKGSTELLLQIQCQKNEFFTSNKPNSWICFEFKKHQINPTNYSIRSFNGIETAQHLKSWVIEGSKDKNDWKMLDEQKDNPVLKGANIVHTFPIKENDEAFKYLRLRLTGPNWFWSNTNNRLYICSIEFYGQLI